MKVVANDAHLGHDITDETTLGAVIAANEAPERAELIRATLAADPTFDLIGPTEHGIEPIEAVHDPGLVRFLEQIWTQSRAEGWPRRHLVPEAHYVRGLVDGMDEAAHADPAGQIAGRLGREPASVAGRLAYWAFDSSTPIVDGTYAAVRAAVDVALTAADLVVDGGERAAYGLCRPPGHHAARSMYGGYCYLNNAAIATESIVRRTGGRAAILDVDFHHGNGSQQIFWRRPDVLYVSIHADPDSHYPHLLGRADEIGGGPGRGANLNLPLPSGTADEAYLQTLDRALEAIAGLEAAIVVVSLGLDTYRDDPISDFALTTAVYRDVGRRVASLGRPLVIVQEGGYHRPTLGANVRSWLEGVAEA